MLHCAVMEVLLAEVALPLKVIAAIVVFGPAIVFVRFLIRAAREDGEIEEERRRGGSSES